MSVVKRGVVALVAAACLPAIAAAQEAPALGDRQFTASAGVLWSGPYNIGGSTAELRGNGPAAGPITLFTAKSRIAPALTLDLRGGYSLNRHLAVEFGVALSRPHVGVSISRDLEAPIQELPGERLDQYEIGGGATWQPPLRVRMRWPLAPFVSGGAAFLRQLHEDRTLAETGAVFYAGGGARYFLRGGDGVGRAIGVRGDARVNFRTKGIDFEDRMRMYPTFGLSAFVGF